MSFEFGAKVATDARLLKRGCEALLGICSGLIADGELNDREITFLNTWLAENAEVSSTWPGEVVHKRISQVLADGHVSDEERLYLVKTLDELIGGSFSETGAVAGGSTALPIDSSSVVTFPDKSFCFTGQFLFGTRSACERAVEQRDGSISSVKRSLSFLVIGEMSSRDWKYSSFGAKVEQALALKQAGHPVQIVSEAMWVAAL